MNDSTLIFTFDIPVLLSNWNYLYLQFNNLTIIFEHVKYDLSCIYDCVRIAIQNCTTNEHRTVWVT